MAKVTLLYALHLVSVLHVSLSAVCLVSPKCYCNKNNTEIHCKDVPDLAAVEELASKFPGIIYSIRIDGLQQTSINAAIFKGKSVTVLDISGALASVSDDALSGMKGLKVINFEGTSLPTVPKAFSSPTLTTVQMEHGALEDIGDVLQNNTQATDFLFSNNRISNVSANAFSNLKYLTYLNLSCNLLSFLDPSVFQNSRQLKSVDLSHNQLLSIDGILAYLFPKDIHLYGNSLRSVDNAFHPHMEDLKWLSLGGNPDLKLNSTIFQDMPNLLKLDISDNRYTSLDPGILENLDKLSTLLLSGNNFTSIPQSITQYGSRLSTLDLADNSLSSADDLFPSNGTAERIHSLKTLNLSGNDLPSVQFGESSKSVQRLDLSRNRMVSIDATVLEHLTSLRSLNFSNNPLGELDGSCFRNQKQLEVLDLSHTDLSALNHSIQNLIDLEELIIDSSALKSLDETEFEGSIALKSISLRNNNLSLVDGMKSLTNLEMLDLSHNNLTTLTEDTFPVQKKLKKLWMEGNPWICDCKISWLLDWIRAKGTSLEDDPLCHAPPSLRGTPIRSLNHTVLTTVHQDCPEPCDCTCTPKGRGAVVSVDCADRSLVAAPDIYPADTRAVYLNGNDIEQFRGDSEGSYGSLLDLLDLEGNRLQEVELTGSVPNVLRLAKNNLSRLQVGGWNLEGAEEVTLGGNPWICDCEAWSFAQWLVAHKELVKDVQSLRCDNKEVKNKLLIDLVRDDVCKGYFTTEDIILFSALGALVLALWLSAFLFRHSLGAVLYSWGCSCLKAREGRPHPFDALLLFEDADEDFALHVIADGLENSPQFFKLFVPSREVFLTTEAVDVASSVNDCSKIIVILSRTFLENSQCMQLLRSCMSVSSVGSSTRFIFVSRRGLDLGSDDPVLRNSAVLRWGSCLFWQRLRYCMPRKATRRSRWEELLSNEG